MTTDQRFAIIVPLTPTTAGDLQSTIDSALRAYVDQPTATLEVAADGEEPPILLRFIDVARLLSVSLSTIETLAARGDLEVVHIGKAVRVRRDDLGAWLDALTEQQRRRNGGAR